MTQSEYNKLRSEVLRFVSINGYRRAARMLNVSVGSLQKFCAGYTIRPSTAEKIMESFYK